MNKKNKVMVEFRIQSNDVNYEKITELLNIIPDIYWNSGDKIKNTKKLREYSTWGLCTEYEESYDINVQLKKIIEKIAKVKTQLIELCKNYEVNYIFEIIIKIKESSSPAIYFDKDIIEFCNLINAEIDVDLYVN